MAILRINKKHVKHVQDIIKKKPRGSNREEQMASLMKLALNPIWRLGNNYYCQNEDSGGEVLFVPKPAQCELMYQLYVLKRTRFVILKARQLGFSTLIALVSLDRVLTEKGIKFNIVSVDLESAKEMLRDKIKYALDQIPIYMKTEDITNPQVDSSTEIIFGKNWSIKSKVSARSSTCHILHISEWGVTACEDKNKSREIKTGSLPAAKSKKAWVFLESTAMGGESGDFYDKWAESLETNANPERAHEKSFWGLFFPWFDEPAYRLECNPQWISQKTRNYVENLRAWWRDNEGIEIEVNDEQAYWYQETEKDTGLEMFSEHPGSPHEAFNAPRNDTVYVEDIKRLNEENRIKDFEWNRSNPVFAVIDDGGSHDATAVWLVQTDGRSVDLIAYHEAINKEPSYFLQYFRDYDVLKWILPWDSFAGQSASTTAAMFIKAGAQVDKVERATNKIYVAAAKNMLRRSTFRKVATTDGLYHVGNFVWIDGDPRPKHDKHSHAAAALQYVAMAEKEGKLTGRHHTRQKKKKKLKLKPYTLERC